MCIRDRIYVLLRYLSKSRFTSFVFIKVVVNHRHHRLCMFSYSSHIYSTDIIDNICKRPELNLERIIWVDFQQWRKISLLRSFLELVVTCLLYNWYYYRRKGIQFYTIYWLWYERRFAHSTNLKNIEMYTYGKWKQGLQ